MNIYIVESCCKLSFFFCLVLTVSVIEGLSGSEEGTSRWFEFSAVACGFFSLDHQNKMYVGYMHHVMVETVCYLKGEL